MTRRTAKSLACYCGCHDREIPGLATETCPDSGNPICRECLTFAVNEWDETVCSRDPEYREGRPGWRYFTPFSADPQIEVPEFRAAARAP